jgi:hypothetical protein
MLFSTNTYHMLDSTLRVLTISGIAIMLVGVVLLGIGHSRLPGTKPLTRFSRLAISGGTIIAGLSIAIFILLYLTS